MQLVLVISKKNKQTKTTTINNTQGKIVVP